MKKIAKTLAVVMAFLMVFSILPFNLLGSLRTNVFAADNDKEWNFMTATAGDATTIEGATGEYQGLVVDATSGKFAVREGDWALFYTGAVIKVPVDGKCEVTVGNYDTNYSVDGQAATEKTETFSCTGDGGYVSIVATGKSYIGSIKVTYPAVPEKPVLDTSKADVWDFGAEEVEGANNNLTVDVINGFYSSDVAAGTAGATISSFKANDGSGAEAVRFVSDKTNNRIRTTNTSITRYDSKSLAGDDGHTYTGYVYSNSSSTDATRLEVYLYEGDKLTCMLGSNGNEATYILRSPSGEDYDSFNYRKSSSLETAVFYAAETGWYQLYCSNEKLVCARIIREHAPAVTVSGSVTAPADIPAGYGLVFTSVITGKETIAEVKSGAYSVSLYGGYTYNVSLKDANGFVIKEGMTLELDAEDAAHDIAIETVDLKVISGIIKGLSAEALGKVEFEFTIPEGKVYVPEITIGDNGAYSLKVENGVEYTITANNVNDYTLNTTAISAAEDKTADIEFTAKPVYTVTLDITGVADSSNAVATFTNVDEEGYVYTFKVADKMALRDGNYSVKVSGLGNYAVVQGTTANIRVNGAAASTSVPFEAVSSWDFAVLNNSSEIETIGDAQYYTGLTVANALKNKTYLLVNAGGSVIVPALAKGDKVTIKYCYCAAFNAGGLSVDEKSGSTSQIDSVDLVMDADGDLVIEAVKGEKASQTYLCAIEVLRAADVVAYKDTLYVGTDKEFTTINDALACVRKMGRTADQKVTIMIDPGNYEEMLVIDIPNVTLKNASSTPSIELKNKGVDIDDNAVRVTWYYGHGYTYYSMGSDCKYDADILAANKINGYASFKNPGSGTTNGSYWNATVVISADDFNAEGIIFENSFNQYVSAKSVEDVIEAQGSSAKEGTVARADMKTVGDTKVQEKEYVERAAALAITNNVNQVYFNNCKFIGRQDTLYGGTGVTAAFENCAVYGGTDYIFGGMTAVFKYCDLVFNTNDQTSKGEKDDVGYITAPQQSSGRGYLMYECTVTSTTPGVDTASIRTSKPGYLGRPWQANTGEAVFYNTTVEAADEFWNTNYTFGESMIRSEGWNSSLGGQSALCGEYGTIEKADVDNSANRVSWAKVFAAAELADGSPITIETFLGSWNPFSEDAPKPPVSSDLVVEGDDTVSSVTADANVSFLDKDDNAVTGDVIINAEKLDAAPSEEIAAKAESLTEGVIDVQIIYLDIKAYVGSVDDANVVTLSSGNVKIKFAYPQGATKNNEIIALHNTDTVPVDKEDDGFWITADGFSPYTIIIKPAAEITPEPEPPTTPADDDDDDDDEVTTEAPSETAAESSSEAVTETSSEGTSETPAVPKTGDNAPLAVLLVLAFISALGVAVSFKRKYEVK